MQEMNFAETRYDVSRELFKISPVKSQGNITDETECSIYKFKFLPYKKEVHEKPKEKSKITMSKKRKPKKNSKENKYCHDSYNELKNPKIAIRHKRTLSFPE